MHIPKIATKSYRKKLGIFKKIPNYQILEPIWRGLKKWNRSGLAAIDILYTWDPQSHWSKQGIVGF
jgi:hypothetical protein